jgi:hypothetical protein
MLRVIGQADGLVVPLPPIRGGRLLGVSEPPVRADNWAEWADSTTFSTTAPRSQGYDTAEVDALREGLRDTFLGARQPPVAPAIFVGAVTTQLS